MTKNEFAVWLEDKLDKSGLSQNQVAQAAEITQQAVSRYMKGKNTPPLEIAERIANVFGYSFKIAALDEYGEEI